MISNGPFEFAHLGSNETILCIKYWVLESDGQPKIVVVVGSLVSMSIATKEMVTSILEDARLGIEVGACKLISSIVFGRFEH